MDQKAIYHFSSQAKKKKISFYTLPSNRYACFCAKYEQCPQWSISVRLDQLLVGHLPLPQIYSPKHFNFHMNLCKHSWVTTVWQIHKSIFSSVCKLEKSYVGGAKWSLKLVFFNLAPPHVWPHLKLCIWPQSLLYMHFLFCENLYKYSWITTVWVNKVHPH